MMWVEFDDVSRVWVIWCVPGTKYMLVDCGGGTVDITVHEMESHGRLKELYKATGGPYGSVGSYKFYALFLHVTNC